MTHIEYDACSHAVLQWYLIQGITVARTVHFFFMENMVRGIHVCAGVESTGIGHGALMEAAQVLPARENQVLTWTREWPQRGVNAPWL